MNRVRKGRQGLDDGRRQGRQWPDVEISFHWVGVPKISLGLKLISPKSYFLFG